SLPAQPRGGASSRNRHPRGRALAGAHRRRLRRCRTRGTTRGARRGLHRRAPHRRRHVAGRLSVRHRRRPGNELHRGLPGHDRPPGQGAPSRGSLSRWHFACSMPGQEGSLMLRLALALLVALVVTTPALAQDRPAAGMNREQNAPGAAGPKDSGVVQRGTQPNPADAPSIDRLECITLSVDPLERIALDESRHVLFSDRTPAGVGRPTESCYPWHDTTSATPRVIHRYGAANDNGGRKWPRLPLSTIARTRPAPSRDKNAIP